MKYSRLLFPIIFLFSTTHTHYVTHAVIAEKASQIETKMKRDRYCFYGLALLSLAYHIGQSYQGLKFALSDDSSSQQQSKEKISMFQAFKNGCWNLVYTPAGWTATAHVFVAMGSSIFVSKLCEKLAHPDTLRWYIHTYAPYHLTLKMMKERLAELQNASLSVQEFKANCEIIHLLYDRLVRQGLLICAYITYKTKHLDDEEKALAQRLQSFIMASQNKWFDSLGAQLTADNRDYQAITKALTAYEADIASQITHFATVEGETPYDRAILKHQKEAQLNTAHKSN